MATNLGSSLEGDINEIEAKHAALITAVKNWRNGSIATATQDLEAAGEDLTKSLKTKETALLGLIQASTTKPVPSLLLDFQNQIYMQGARRLEHGYSADDLMLIARSGSVRVWGSQGDKVELPSDVLAYHYDPVSGEPLGVLRQDVGTNLFPWSETDGVNWPIWNGSRWGNTPIEMRGVILDHYIGGTISIRDVPSTSTYATWSLLFFDGGEDTNSDAVLRGEFRNTSIGNGSGTVKFDYATKEFSLGSGNGTWEMLTEDLGGDLYYVELRGTLPPGETTDALRTAIYGDNKWLGGFQLEEAPTASSYMRTTGTPVTRAKDSIRRALGDEFNRAGVTIVVDYTLLAPRVPESGTDQIFAVNASNGIITVRHGPTLNNFDFYGRLDGEAFIDSGGPKYSIGTPAKVAVSWGINGSEVAFTGWPGNGSGAAQGTAPPTLPEDPVLHLGTGSNVAFRSVAVYPHETFGAELAALVDN